MTTADPVILRSAGGRTEAEFLPSANMLCCSLRHRGTEHLDHGQGIVAYAQQGKTMGVPLLYPWANRLSRFGYRAAGKAVALPAGDPRIPVDPGGLPIHGVLPGLLRWEAEPTASHEGLRARLAWETPELMELFPYRHELRVEARVSDGELTIATTLEATGDDAVPVSFGYHPYVSIPGVPRRSWGIELAVSKRLVVDERMIPTGELAPIARRSFELGEESLDDGFEALEPPARFEASGGQRGVRIEFLEGYPYAQVYAPAGHDYVCFEPMTAPTDALNSGEGLRITAPGEEYRAAFRIGVRG